MTDQPQVVTLDDRTGITEEQRQVEARALTEKLVRTGLFQLSHDDLAYQEQAKWMVYQSLIVEDICQLADIGKLTKDIQNRQELLHESLLHFTVDVPGSSAWNLAQEVEFQMIGFPPYQPSPSKAATAFEGVVEAMGRFRAATESGDVLGSWLEVWASISALVADLLGRMAVHGGHE